VTVFPPNRTTNPILPFTASEVLSTKSRTSTIFQSPPAEEKLIKGRGSQDECESDNNMDEERVDFHSAVIVDNGMTEMKTKVAHLLVEEPNEWLEQEVKTLAKKNKGLQLQNDQLTKELARLTIKYQVDAKDDDQHDPEEPKIFSNWEFREDLRRNVNGHDIISFSKKRKLDPKASGETFHQQQQIPAFEIAMKKQKEELLIKHMHDRLKLNHEHMLTINTMRDSMTNLNDYVITLKKEVSRLKSIKGLNANARVFNPFAPDFPPVKSRTISTESQKEQQKTDMPKEIKNNDRQEHDGVSNMLVNGGSYPGNLHESYDSSKVSSSLESSGVNTPRNKQRKKKPKWKNKRKKNRSHKYESNDENKYLAMAPMSYLKNQHPQKTSLNGHNKRVQNHGQSNSKSNTQSSSQSPMLVRKSTLKGLKMGPHDPNFTCRPPKAVNSKKKNKRKCYHKIKD